MRFCALLSTVGVKKTFPISFRSVLLKKSCTYRIGILTTPSLSFYFLSPSLSLLLSNSSGGTTYIIEGKDLSIAQIRHLVFYLIPVKEDTPSMADNQNDGPPTESPPEGPPDNSKGPTFSVPTPLLITDPVTKCAETWDYKSEVGYYV